MALLYIEKSLVLSELILFTQNNDSFRLDIWIISWDMISLCAEHGEIMRDAKMKDIIIEEILDIFDHPMVSVNK